MATKMQTQTNATNCNKRSATMAGLLNVIITKRHKTNTSCNNNDNNRDETSLESKQEPPPNYICHKCLNGGHWINDCPQNNSNPPPHYICHKCLRNDHWIQHCPLNNNTDNTSPSILTNNCNKLPSTDISEANNNNNNNTENKLSTPSTDIASVKNNNNNDSSTDNKISSKSMDELPSHYICHKCLKKGHWIQNCPVNNNHISIMKETENILSNDNDKMDIPPINYMCHRCNLCGHWIRNCPTNNHQNIVNKPQWHAQYMNIYINGNLIKISENGGVIKRDKNNKCNENEDDLIIFYWQHCNEKFINEYKTKQQDKLPLFVKFFIGFPKYRKNNQLLLAYNVEFDVLNKNEKLDKIYGEILKLANYEENRNGWIYCKDNNLMYCFNDDLNTHYNIGNIVLFNNFIKNDNSMIGKQNWAKNIRITQKYDENVWKSIYNEENKCIHDNKHKLFIKECEIDLHEDIHNEFKQFHHLNGRCHIIKICETMLKYLNAFINTNGGSIYFGINDKGIIKGIKYVNNEVIDNIGKYIDNRLKEWKPNHEWQNVKKRVSIQYIDVIERKKDDNYCYKLPDLKVVKASIDAMQLNKNVIFKNHDNQSWTRNMASVSNITNVINI